MYTLITGKKPPCAPDRWLYLDHGDYSAGNLNTFASFGAVVPAYVENSIRHGMALRPEDRTQSMEKLWDELSGKSAPQIIETTQMAEPGRSFAAEKPKRKDVNVRKKGVDKGWIFLILLWLIVLTAIMLLLLLRVRL